jgi:amidase
MPALADAARVLDALKDPATGYYDSRDPFTAVPRALVSRQLYASFAIAGDALRANPKPLQGVRIGILREHMVKRTPNEVAISDQMDREIKTVLRDRLGAELVESITPDYPDDPDVPNMRYSFTDALSEILPWMMPEIFGPVAGRH